jgi:uncharacterized protein YndB with AHSA1/START domain
MAINIEIVETLNHPAEKVFAALTDIQHHPAWMEEVQSITRPPQMPLGVGATYQQSARFNGRDVLIDTEVIAFEPNRLLKLKSTGTMPTVTTWKLTPDGNDTLLHFAFDGEPGDLYDMISAGMEGAIKRGFQAQLQKLKAVIDSRA